MEKLTCGVIQDLLISYYDGLTGDGITQMLQEHLEECPRCQKQYEKIKIQREMEYNEELSKGKGFGDKLKGIRHYMIGIVLGLMLPVAVILVWYIFSMIASYFETMFYSYFI